jgi:ubiquinone biosynthesis protein
MVNGCRSGQGRLRSAIKQQRHRVRTQAATMRSAYTDARRLWQISAALFRFFVVDVLRPSVPEIPPEQRFRHMLQSLGGVWTKGGQALALRFDVLPRSYCTELLQLLDDNPTFPYETVRQIIFRELGGYPEQIFASFDAEPLAAASIAQVHRATTHDGVELAIKVQRPNVRQQFQADFRIINVLSRIIELVNSFAGKSIRNFSNEFKRWADEEVDFHNEARNGNRLWLRSKDDPLQHCARIHFEYCTDRVLATELLKGVPLIRLLSATGGEDRQLLQSLNIGKHDRRQIARNYFWVMCNQVFSDGVFHADPHPANIIVLPGNRIGFVDFGTMGQLTMELRRSLAGHFVSLSQGRIEEAVDELFRLLVPSRKSDIRQAHDDMVVAFENYWYGLGVSRARTRELTSELFIETMSVVRRHQIVMPQTLSLYYKTVLTMDSVMRELAPDYDSLLDLEKFFIEAMANSTNGIFRRVPERFLAMRYKVNQLLNEAETLAAPLQSIDNSLRSIQTRSTLYGICSVAFCIGAYLAHEDGAALTAISGIGRHWFVYGLVAAAIVLLLFMRHQLQEIPRGLDDTSAR